MLFEEFMTDNVSEDEFSRLFNGRNSPVLVHGHCYVKALTGTAALMRCPEAGGLCTFRNGQRPAAAWPAVSATGPIPTRYRSRLALSGCFLQLMPFPKKRSDLRTHGFSCRHQIADGTGRQACTLLCCFGSHCAKPRKNSAARGFSNSLIWLDLTLNSVSR